MVRETLWQNDRSQSHRAIGDGHIVVVFFEKGEHLRMLAAVKSMYVVCEKETELGLVFVTFFLGFEGNCRFNIGQSVLCWLASSCRSFCDQRKR